MSVKLVSDIATANEIAKANHQRELKEARELFKVFNKFHKSEWRWNWLQYSGNHGIHSSVASIVWEERLRKKRRSNKKQNDKKGTPYQQSKAKRKRKSIDRKKVIGTPYQKATQHSKQKRTRTLQNPNYPI